MKQYKVGDKVHIKGSRLAKPGEIFTIAEVVGGCFYCLEEEEIAHFYIQEANYENIYFAGDLLPVYI